ncbi:MAG: hypothetical protein FWC60_07495 [Firmicutes bacterium]|nr:hypothetical protein [Bacillota bacterium]
MGSEVCGNFLSSGDFLNAFNAYIWAGHQVGIIAPYLTPKREISFITWLENLSNRTEIVVNDVGAFRLVQKSKHIPIPGRLLMRQNTDPVIPSFFQSQPDRDVYDGADYVRLKHSKPSQALTVHLQNSPVFSPEASALFLADREEITVMMDQLPQGLPAEIPRQYRVMLNTDNILVTVLPCRSCADCPQEEMLLGRVRTNIPIYRKRNACYYKLADVLKGNDNLIIPPYVVRQIGPLQ